MKNMFIFAFFTLVASQNFLWARDLRGKKYVEGELIVKYYNNTTSSIQRDSIKGNGVRSIKALRKRGLHHIKIDPKKSLEAAMEDFKFDPDVEYVQPNYIYNIKATPNDTYFSRNWALYNSGQSISATGLGWPDAAWSGGGSDNPGTANKDMKLKSAWDIVTNCSSIKVAVLDTGVNYNHADLSANMWNGGVNYPNHGYDYVDNDNSPMDLHGHGTHVAATIGAVGNNSTGVTGVCWSASIIAVRVLDQNGSGTTDQIVDGINFAVARGAKIINMSLGGENFDQAELDAIVDAKTSGVLFVVAAGNEGGNVDDSSASTYTPTYPCKFAEDNILCVAALTQKYNLASFSNFGTTSVDVGAPGVNIVSAWPGTHTTTSDTLSSGWDSNNAIWGKSGSSYSCPSNYDGSSANYPNNADARIWKSYDLTTAAAASISFRAKYTFSSGDVVKIKTSSSSGDPTSLGTYRGDLAGTSGSYLSYEVDLTNFISPTTTVGFQFTSNSSGTNLGIIMDTFKVTHLVLNSTTYNVISGTSMATPNAAGVAALLMSYNPNFTYLDVISSLKNGGDTISALSGKSVSGKAINATNSLAYINAPTGGAASIVP